MEDDDTVVVDIQQWPERVTDEYLEDRLGVLRRFAADGATTKHEHWEMKALVELKERRALDLEANERDLLDAFVLYDAHSGGLHAGWLRKVVALCGIRDGIKENR